MGAIFSSTLDQVNKPLIQNQDNIVVSAVPAVAVPAVAVPAVAVVVKATTLLPTAYGETYFFVFMCVILSRLAYEDEAAFVIYYNIIFKYLILEKMLIQINDQVKNNNDLKSLKDEEEMFALQTGSNASVTKITTISENLHDYDYKIDSYFNPYAGVSRIQFIPIAKRINFILNEVSESQSAITDPKELAYCKTLKNMTSPPPNQLRFVTINTSNYGTIYIMRDIRMPNIIFIIFRGTNSLKSAESYSNSKSAIPIWISDLAGTTTTTTKEKYLEGIYKLLNDTIHLIMDAIAFLSQDVGFLTGGDKIKIITTGHSLGGGLCTIFSTLVESHIKAHLANKAAHFDKINFDQVGCISVASPRVMSTELAIYVCENYTKPKEGNPSKIFYIRLTSRGDPVPDLPFKAAGFGHPCSEDITGRKNVYENCNASLNTLDALQTSLVPKYDKPLNCLTENSYFNSNNMKSPFAHLLYLDISFRHAANISAFINIKRFTPDPQEVKPDLNGNAVCRLMFLNDDNKFKIVFFDLSKRRSGQGTQDKWFEKHKKMIMSKKISLAEDDKDTYAAFTEFLSKAHPIDLSNTTIDELSKTVQGADPNVDWTTLTALSEEKETEAEAAYIVEPTKTNTISDTSVKPIKTNTISDTSVEPKTNTISDSVYQPPIETGSTEYIGGSKRINKRRRNKTKKRKQRKSNKIRNKKRHNKTRN